MNDKKIITPQLWFAEYDRDGNLTNASFAAARLDVQGKVSNEELMQKYATWTETVHPDDVEQVNACWNDMLKKHPEGHDYDVEYRNITEQGYHWFHDYGHCKRREDGSLERVDGIIIDIQDIVEKEEDRKGQIARLAGTESTYIVNPLTERFQILGQNEYLADNYTDDEDFNTSFSRYIEKDVFGPDKAMVAESINVPTIAAHLEKEDEYVVRYRDISKGYPHWFEMRAVKLSENEILYGFSDKDEEIIVEMLFDNMMKSYFGLYYVNLDTGHAQIIKTGHPEITGEAGLFVSYTDLIDNISSSSEGDTQDFFARIRDIDYLREYFKTEEVAFNRYRSYVFEGDRWVSVTSNVVTKHRDGTPSVITLGFSLLDEDSREKEETNMQLQKVTSELEKQHKILRRQLEIISGLATEYTALYYVNLDTDEYISYYIINKAEDIKPFYEKNQRFVDLAHGFADSPLVRPEDRDSLYNFYPSAAEVKERMKDKKIMTMLFKRNYEGEFLWTEVSIVKCEDENEEAHNVVIGFVEKDQEVEERTRSFREAEEANKIVDGVVSKYSVAFTVNMESNAFKLLKVDDNLEDKFAVFSSYEEARQTLISILHPNDRDRIMAELSFENIKEKLKYAHSYTDEYRTVINGSTKWHEMNITAVDENEVVMGFSEKDLEITKRRLEDKRYEEYLALFTVDLDTAMIKPLKTSSLFETAGVGESVPYEYGMKQFAAMYEGEAKEFFTHISSIENVKREFAKDDKRTFSYKSAKLEGDKWIDVVSYVILRHDDGTPAMITIGFSMVDALATIRKELLVRLTENMQMIGGLASGYNALYYINIDENRLHIYTLDEAKYPGSRAIFEGEEKDFYKIIGGYGLSDQVHPDDRHLFEDFGPEWIREMLADKKKYGMPFRAATDNGYRWDEMELVKYEAVGEKANAVAIGFTDRDEEIRSEQAINNTFDVLAREVSVQEAIDHILSIAGEFYDADRCYVFEYYPNRGEFDNTYEWCAAGVEPMIAALQNLPLSEVEGWNSEFRRQGAFYMDSLDSEHNSETGKEILEMQGIDSLVAAPLMSGGEIVGFIGVDNPAKAKSDISILNNAASVVYSEILKRKENDEEHVTLDKLTDSFLSVYYADLNTDYMRTWRIAEEYKDAYGSVMNYSTSMGGYVRNDIAENERERCIEMTSPEYVLEQFKTTDRFSIDMTDIMLGYERNIVMDYIKVNDDGSQLVICSRDVTDTLAKEKEQQKMLEDAREAAEAANRSKTSFLFNMSHDIRTPMNAITGFTTMAKKHTDDEAKVVEYLDKIDISGQQLLTLVNQVLEMARIESGKITFEEKPINVKEEFNTMVTVLSEQAVAKGLTFKHSIENIENNYVLADEARMSSITLNIIGNAMKYTREGGTVEYNLKEIESRKPGYATFVFTVADTGIGMSREFLETLYEPFTREQSSTVSKIQGTGLGMSIVKSIIDLLGGEIKVQSEKNKGTRFDITLDFKIADTVEKTAEEQISSETFKGRRVLLVEDNEMNREIARDILEEQGLIVDDAEDGDIAVEMIKAIVNRGEFHYYDFILMDIQMPRMNGYEATKIIRAIPGPDGVHIPIIAMTANAFEEDRQNALAAGMDEHLAKPIDVQKMFKTIAKFL